MQRVWCKIILTALAILGHFDAAVDQTFGIAGPKNIVDEATARIEQAWGGVDARPRLLRGIESWMDERATEARPPPRSAIDL
jgi:hypothetical protein